MVSAGLMAMDGAAGIRENERNITGPARLVTSGVGRDGGGKMSVGKILIAALAVAAIGTAGVRAQERLEIFDAHLHYNQEPAPFY